MQLRDWDKRYRSGDRADDDLNVAPNPLVVETAKDLVPGKALDLACGTGRNALWLAEHGWKVTAVDGAPAAIEILNNRAADRGLKIETIVADLEKAEYRIEPSQWDLIAICYYLQRDLFEPAKDGLKPRGIPISIVHVTEPGEEPTPYSLRSGELEGYFTGWEILHRYEGKANDLAHHRAVAEIVIRRPIGA
jgi:tellurite methyltransferase